VSRESISEIRVGQQPMEEYVLAALMDYHAGVSKIIVKGRGFLVCKAVDVANEIVARLGEDIAEIGEVDIHTERVRERDRVVRRTAIEITINIKS